MQVNPTTASTTNVSGTATLAGTVQANFSPGSFVERSYTILTAAGGRAGTFDALTTVGLPANFQASLSYTGNTAVLNLQPSSFHRRSHLRRRHAGTAAGTACSRR